jgi:tRNA nucleotidyltransferase/poly(A) polymerase
VAPSTHIAMSSKASLALMKFLADLAKSLGVSRHVYVVGGAVRNFVIRQPIKDRRAA